MSSLLHFSTKANFTTTEALLFFLLAAVMAVGLCSTTALRRRRRQSAQPLPKARIGNEEEGEELVVSWGGISEVMARVLRWSGRSERVGMAKSGVGWRDVEATAAAKGVGNGNSVAMSPVWQRRILMGERCQMPIFSGVILYDERGRLLGGNSGKAKQEKPVAPMTTLKELL